MASDARCAVRYEMVGDGAVCRCRAARRLAERGAMYPGTRASNCYGTVDDVITGSMLASVRPAA
ncbi:hypothetical protein MPSYJ_23060 [Mycolicibacterium psychrotolerans]|uniref:Uncharacterized protein n=1 Tax=Mycolicibacterium psychrotolerans TaxID=216929 RepID=A0A7I7M9I1_9MYCO|nr:hypothetical protein MPSYJ_23060 [Mycolicibacterium psychrotolerans]